MGLMDFFNRFFKNDTERLPEGYDTQKNAIENDEGKKNQTRNAGIREQLKYQGANLYNKAIDAFGGVTDLSIIHEIPEDLKKSIPADQISELFDNSLQWYTGYWIKGKEKNQFAVAKKNNGKVLVIYNGTIYGLVKDKNNNMRYTQMTYREQGGYIKNTISFTHDIPNCYMTHVNNKYEDTLSTLTRNDYYQVSDSFIIENDLMHSNSLSTLTSDKNLWPTYIILNHTTTFDKDGKMVSEHIEGYEDDSLSPSKIVKIDGHNRQDYSKKDNYYMDNDGNRYDFQKINDQDSTQIGMNLMFSFLHPKGKGLIPEYITKIATKYDKTIIRNKR